MRAADRQLGDGILIVTQCYWPEPTGSAPVVADLAGWLAGRGERVSVLTARPSYPENRVYAAYRDGSGDRQTHDGVTIRRVRAFPMRGGRFLGRLWHEGVLAAQMMWLSLRPGAPRYRYVLSVCPSLLLVLVGVVAKRRGGTHLCLVHDIQSGLAARLGLGGGVFGLRLLRWLEKATLSRADSLVLLSDEMRRTLAGMAVTRPMIVLPPHVNTDTIRPLPTPGRQPKTVLYSGNFGHKQGLDQILDAAAILNQRRPDIRFVLRGAGNVDAALRAKATTLNLTNTAIEGLAPAERFNEAMAEGDIHLVPQRPEGADFAVPSKAYAIMAAGRPYIATALPDTPLDRLSKESDACLVVPPGDPHALANAIVSLADDPARCAEMAAAGRRWVEANASREAVLGRLFALLQAPKAAY